MAEELEASAFRDRPVVRMMVLETDEPHPETKSRCGTFGEILHHHFLDAGNAHDPPLGIETDTRYVISEKGGSMPKFQDFKNCHALLITGSTYSASGNDPWILELLALLKELWLHHPRMCFSGVCFGHQLLCRLLGSEISSAAPTGWELGHTKISLTPAGQRLFRTDKSEVYLHQMHQDYVVAPPTPESSGGLLAPGTEVEAHLAFDDGMVKRQIQMRVESGSIQDTAHADKAAETGKLEHDGDVVAAAILRFFHDEGGK
ncbi:hypothetical protein VTG60DRAFT_531 [Thermothelomyces hinnuleus]